MIERLELAAAYTVITMALTLSVAVAVRGDGFSGEADGATPFQQEQQFSTADFIAGDVSDDGAGDSTGDDSDGADSGDQVGAVDGEESVDGADDPGCVEALSDNAQSQEELGDHVANPDKPEGSVDGNQNALDSQCGGAFAEEPPVSDGDAPAESATGPGKSEQANGGGNGNANGGGQGNADSNGNGPSGARGHLKP